MPFALAGMSSSDMLSRLLLEGLPEDDVDDVDELLAVLPLSSLEAFFLLTTTPTGIAIARIKITAPTPIKIFFHFFFFLSFSGSKSDESPSPPRNLTSSR